MPEKVYVVTDDGYFEGYGSEIYLIGVFADRETAEQVIQNYGGTLTEIAFNKEFPMTRSTWGGRGNDYYLGGYFE